MRKREKFGEKLSFSASKGKGKGVKTKQTYARPKIVGEFKGPDFVQGGGKSKENNTTRENRDKTVTAAKVMIDSSSAGKKVVFLHVGGGRLVRVCTNQLPPRGQGKIGRGME